MDPHEPSQSTPAAPDHRREDRSALPEKLRGESGLFRLLFERTAEALLLLDVASRQFIECNQAAAALLHYPDKHDLLPRHPAELSPPGQPDGQASREKAEVMIATALARGSHRFEWIHCSAHRADFPVEVLLTPIQLQGRQLILVSWRDITERKRTEAALLRTNRTLRLISECNQVLVRATDERQLLDAICRLVVEQGGYRFAWVGFAETDPARSVRPVAQSGHEDGYLDRIRITWADSERGRCPAGRAIRTGQPHGVWNIATDPDFAPWRTDALQRGYAAIIALPLRGPDRTFGTLVLYGAQPDIFDEAEIALLMELAGDLAFGLTTLRDQAEHTKAKEQLILLNAALVAAPNPVTITDARGTIEWVNPAFTASSGYSFAEAVGQNPRLLNSGRQPAAYYADLWRTIQAGHNWHGEFINRRKNGELYTEDVTIAPIRDSAGVIRHYVALKLDISARRHTEESQRRLAAIVESTTDLVSQADAAGRLIYLNAAGLRLLGYETWAEIAGRPIAEFHPPASAERVQHEGIPTAVREGTWTGETELIARDGRLIPVSQIIIAGRAVDGTVTHSSAIIRDLTERRRAEARLFEQAEVIDKAPIAVIITDLAHRVTYCNEGALQLYGLTREDFMGHTAEELFTAETMRQLAAGRTATLTTGRWNGELPVVTKTGRSFHAEFHMALIPDAAGRPKARLSIATDITEKKKIEAQLFRAQRLESLGMLAAGIAHDLNNVLAPILMAAPLLREHATTAGDLRMLESVEKSAERGARLVRQILGFAHGTGGEFHPTAVKHLLHELVSVIEETFPKNIRLEQMVPADLWLVKANATQIHQVLLNLCVNARDAMPRGGTLRLHTENVVLDDLAAQALEVGQPDLRARAGAWLLLHVEDTGTGIPPAVLAQMWEPFFTTKGEGKGTGLGLSTVRGLIAAHGGFVTVTTSAETGTAFRVYLPALETNVGGATSAVLADSPLGHDELVLIVDDEVAIRSIATAVLTRHGYRVLAARDGVEAVALFAPRAAEIALVLSDIHMPNLGGPDLALVLTRIKPGVKILAMSGLSAPSTQALAARPQDYAAAFMRKPFTMGDLLLAVHRALQPVAPP